MKKTLICAVVAMVLAVSGLASGTVIVVDPDAFPADTVLNNAYTGVTVTALGDGLDNSDVLSLTSSLATTGSRVFGHTGGFNDVWGNGDFDWLKVDFAGGATQVSLDFIANDTDDDATLKAYDAVGNLVDQDVSIGSYSRGQHVTLTVSAADIAYIYAECDPVDHVNNWALDNLVYTPVPEPATICLLGLGGLLLRRRKSA